MHACNIALGRRLSELKPLMVSLRLYRLGKPIRKHFLVFIVTHDSGSIGRSLQLGLVLVMGIVSPFIHRRYISLRTRAVYIVLFDELTERPHLVWFFFLSSSSSWLL